MYCQVFLRIAVYLNISTYDRMPDRWNISAMMNARYGMTTTIIGSMTRMCRVNRVEKAPARPISVPMPRDPTTTTKNETMPSTMSTAMTFSPPITLSSLNTW